MRFPPLLAIITLAGLAIQCSPTQIAVAPVVNSSGEPCLAKPRKFALDENTKGSSMLALLEDVTEPLDEDWTNAAVGARPENGELAQTTIVFGVATAWEKSKSAPEKYLLPVVGVEFFNIEKERIEAAMPNIQKAAYRLLERECKMIPASRFREDYQSINVN